MSVLKYLHNFIIYRSVTLRDIADATGISYKVLVDYHTERATSFSIDTLEKLAKHLNVSPVMVYYDTVNDDIAPESLVALKYLSEKYLEDYSVKVHPTFESYKPIQSDGFYIKKRYSNGGVVVDSWKTIEERYKETFNPGYDPEELMSSYTDYLIVALNYSSNLVLSLADKKISSYTIVFGNDEQSIYDVIKQYLDNTKN